MHKGLAEKQTSTGTREENMSAQKRDGLVPIDGAREIEVGRGVDREGCIEPCGGLIN